MIDLQQKNSRRKMRDVLSGEIAKYLPNARVVATCVRQFKFIAYFAGDQWSPLQLTIKPHQPN
jgi:hypothetical protein